MKNLSFIGNIGNDSELKTLQNGVVLNFSVAIYEGKDDKGEARKPTWVNCQYYFKDADKAKVNEYLKKGTKVYISGRPRVNAYLDKQQAAQAELICVVDYFELLSKKEVDDEPSF